MNWYKKSQESQEWFRPDFKEVKQQDPLSPEERNIVDYLQKYFLDNWISVSVLLSNVSDAQKDYDNRYNFYLHKILTKLWKKNIIELQEPKTERDSWHREVIRLTEKGQDI